MTDREKRIDIPIAMHMDFSDQQVRPSEGQFRAIFEFAAVGIALIDTNTGELIRLNRKYCDLIGYQAEELKGKSFMDISQIDDLPSDLENMRKLHLGEVDSFSLEKRLIHKVGRDIWVNLTVSPLWQPGAEPDFHVAVVEDISERIRVSLELRESEKSLAKAQEIAKLANWQLDFSTRLISVSDQMFQIFGSLSQKSSVDAESFLQPFLAESVHADDREHVRAAYLESFNTGTIKPLEFRIIRISDKRERIVRAETELEMDENGNPTKLVGTVQDITDRRRADELQRQHELELMHVSRLATMGEMVAGIAHEINQPLFSITNFANSCVLVLRNNNPENIKLVEEWLGAILKQSTRASAIIRRLANFVRNDEPSRRKENVNQLVSKAIELTSFEARHRKVLVETELFPQAVIVLADGVQIQQVIVNLVRNGIEAFCGTDERVRRICVSVSVFDNHVQIDVADNGPGLSGEINGKLFDAFVTTKADGMGMGLAICRSIIKSHDGIIEVSKNENVGATFTIRLPRMDGVACRA